MTKVFRYADNIDWSLPLLFEAEYLYGLIYYYLKQMGIKVSIKANLFGAPATAWSGGRTCPIIKDLRVCEQAFKFVNEMEAYPTLTFTNPFITKKTLKDKDANYVFDMALEHNARFIVVSDLLRDYIKNKAPEACVVASVTKAIFKYQTKKTYDEETEYYNKLLKEYDVVVVRPEYSKNILTKYANQIDDISRIEVLINQTCTVDCPKATKHYLHFGEMNNGKKINEDFTCYKVENSISSSNLIKSNLIHSPTNIKKLVKCGIKRLKIQGRASGTHPLRLYFNIIRSLIEDNDSNYYILNDLIRKFIYAQNRRMHIL